MCFVHSVTLKTTVYKISDYLLVYDLWDISKQKTTPETIFGIQTVLLTTVQKTPGGL